MEYKELLLNPEWQKKRLAVFERDEWKCVQCGEWLENLQVHHLYYISDSLPWEYPLSALQTLCSLCHQKAEFLKWVVRYGSANLRTLGFNEHEVRDIVSAITKKTISNRHKESSLEYMEDIKKLLISA